MPDLKQFLLPDVGEGLTEAEIIKWDVAPGDTVTVNQTLVEIETAKAAVELPSPYAGVVTALHVAPGDTVDVGRPIITIDIAPGSAAGGERAESVPARRRGAPAGAGRLRSQGGRAGPAPALGSAMRSRPTRAGRPTSRTAAGCRSSRPGRDPSSGGDPSSSRRPVARCWPSRRSGCWRRTSASTSTEVDRRPARTAPCRATTSSRRRRPAADRRAARLARSASAVSGERETRVPVRGVRKHTAAAMVASAFTAPHVTVFQTVDVTAMMELRERIAARPRVRGVKVSPLVLLAKAVLIAAAATPEINASWDEAAGEIVLKHYVNLGIAAATPRGLIVPNIKDADQLSLRELAVALGELTETARAGTTTPADLAGGTITITNIGVFGVDTGTPILNPGESGIVAFGAVARRPWVVDEQVVPRWVTTLAVSFDHRIVDGQQGAQFLSTVAGILSDPGLALL